MVAFGAEIGSVCNSFWSWFAARRYSFCGGSLLSWCADTKTPRSPLALFQAHCGPAAWGKTTGLKRTWHCKDDTSDLFWRGRSCCWERRAKDIEVLFKQSPYPELQSVYSKRVKWHHGWWCKTTGLRTGGRGNHGGFFVVVWIFFYGSENYFSNANMGKLLSSLELDLYFTL